MFCMMTHNRDSIDIMNPSVQYNSDHVSVVLDMIAIETIGI